MTMDHISDKAMRSYLLGQLRDDQAAALEEEYFSNRDCLLKIQTAETALIADYLDGTLTSAEKQRFEDRYLKVPLLQKKVEDVRRQRNALKPAPQPISRGWRIAFALAVVFVIGLGIWVYRLKTAGPPGIAAGILPSQVHSVIGVRISPGQTKGENTKQVQFLAPESGSTINLILELPGQFSPVQCQVRIFLVGSNRDWVPVWSSTEPLSSSRDGDSQVLTLQIGGSLLQPGDYVVEVKSPDGQVQEEYVYRVNRI